MMICFLPQLHLSIFWQEILREMLLCFEVLFSHFHKHLLVASVRESKTARSIYTPAQWDCVCVCLWLESLYACIHWVLSGGFPNRKDIFRTVNMNSVISCTTEITPQYISVKIDSIKGRKFFFQKLVQSCEDFSCSPELAVIFMYPEYCLSTC